MFFAIIEEAYVDVAAVDINKKKALIATGLVLCMPVKDLFDVLHANVVVRLP